MDILAALPQVAVPGKDIECRDHELVHPKALRRHALAYGRLTGRVVDSVPSLVDAFFTCHESAQLCGFKSMPNRHPDLSHFIARPDIQFITIIRRDLAATVASFMLAMERGSWRRDGGQPLATWTFTRTNAKCVADNLAYVVNSSRILARIPDSIVIEYEALCRPDFSNARLNDFFGAPIALSDPKPPTDASRYVTNWDAFIRFIDQRLAQRHQTPRD